MTDIDTQLREVFARISEPGDPAGVAQSIRTRMDAGDTGTPAPSNGQSSGFGGGAPGILPWVGLVLVAGLVGGVSGATGLFSAPFDAQQVVSISVAGGGVDATSCPGGGSVVEHLFGGERVVATARSEDSASLAVRDPYDLGRTVWLPADVIKVDSGQPAVSTLPVSGCVAAAITVAPTPTAVPKPHHTKSPTPSTGGGSTDKPKPAKDTKKPTTGTPTSSNASLWDCDAGVPSTVVISVSASDNVGVKSVTVTWTGSDSGSHSMTKSGGLWKYTYNPPVGAGGTVSFTVKAKDAAGNTSPASGPVSAHVNSCPI